LPTGCNDENDQPVIPGKAVGRDPESKSNHRRLAQRRTR
jgi:hypothetical protein